MGDAKGVDRRRFFTRMLPDRRQTLFCMVTNLFVWLAAGH
jgi:hypothetical protein